MNLKDRLYFAFIIRFLKKHPDQYDYVWKRIYGEMNLCHDKKEIEDYKLVLSKLSDLKRELHIIKED